jgi:mono/diheme cytochrome c family protein
MINTTTTTRIALVTLAFGVALLAALPAQAQDAKKGEAVYTAQKCSLCHQVAGKGNKANPLDGIGAKLKADEIHEWIVNPTEAAKKANSTKKPPMPNKYGTLPKADIDNLVAYMQSLK